MGTEQAAVVGVGWLALFASAFFLRPRRVQGESTVVARDHASESTVDAGVHGDGTVPGRGRPGRVHGHAHLDHGPDTVVVADEDDEKPLIFMGVRDTVDAFVDYMLAGEPPYRFTYERWLTNFRAWGRENRVALVPDTIFLAALGRHPFVRKGRDRLKTRDGSVVRLDTEARSPKRRVVYILEQPRRLPGKVPVADVVPAEPVLTRRQREAARAAGAAAQWAAEAPEKATQPLRRAA